VALAFLFPLFFAIHRKLCKAHVTAENTPRNRSESKTTDKRNGLPLGNVCESRVVMDFLRSWFASSLLLVSSRSAKAMPARLPRVFGGLSAVARPSSRTLRAVASTSAYAPSPPTRTFVVPSHANNLAAVVDVEERRPEPTVLTPTSDQLGFETNVNEAITREDIGRPIYLDMQVSPGPFFLLIRSRHRRLTVLQKGYHPCRPESVGCHVAVHDESVRQPSFAHTCLWLGD
jgi:hypothetical protein